MSQAADLELLKEIPGYKVILKSVIKTQIQFLMEQLSDQTGEESIVITASVKEGTLSHLGSGMGKGFFDEGRDEIKSQFLGYCLNKSQTKSRAPPSESDHEVQLAPKRKKAKTNHKAGSETSDLELRQNPKKSQFLSSRYTGTASLDTGGLVNQVEDSGESQFLRTPGSVDQEVGQSDSFYAQGAYATSGTSSQYTGDEPDQSAYTGMEGINPQIMVKSEPGGEDDAVAYLDRYGLTGSTDMVYQSDDPGDQPMNQSSFDDADTKAQPELNNGSNTQSLIMVSPPNLTRYSSIDTSRGKMAADIVITDEYVPTELHENVSSDKGNTTDVSSSEDILIVELATTESLVCEPSDVHGRLSPDTRSITDYSTPRVALPAEMPPETESVGFHESLASLNKSTSEDEEEITKESARESTNNTNALNDSICLSTDIIPHGSSMDLLQDTTTASSISSMSPETPLLSSAKGAGELDTNDTEEENDLTCSSYEGSSIILESSLTKATEPAGTPSRLNVIDSIKRTFGQNLLGPESNLEDNINTNIVKTQSKATNSILCEIPNKTISASNESHIFISTHGQTSKSPTTTVLIPESISNTRTSQAISNTRTSPALSALDILSISPSNIVVPSLKVLSSNAIALLERTFSKGMTLHTGIVSTSETEDNNSIVHLSTSIATVSFEETSLPAVSTSCQTTLTSSYDHVQSSLDASLISRTQNSTISDHQPASLAQNLNSSANSSVVTTSSVGHPFISSLTSSSYGDHVTSAAVTQTIASSSRLVLGQAAAYGGMQPRYGIMRPVTGSAMMHGFVASPNARMLGANMGTAQRPANLLQLNNMAVRFQGARIYGGSSPGASVGGPVRRSFINQGAAGLGHHRQTVLPYSPVLRQTYVRRQGAPAYVASSTGQPLRYGVGLLHVGASTTTSQTHQSPTQQASSTLRYINRPYP